MLSGAIKSFDLEIVDGQQWGQSTPIWSSGVVDFQQDENCGAYVLHDAQLEVRKSGVLRDDHQIGDIDGNIGAHIGLRERGRHDEGCQGGLDITVEVSRYQRRRLEGDKIDANRNGADTGLKAVDINVEKCGVDICPYWDAARAAQRKV